MRYPVKLAALAAVLTLGTCKGPTEPDWRDVLAETAQAEQQWLAARPVRYAITEQRLCECTPQQSGPVRIEVTQAGGGESVAVMTYVGDGQAVPATYAREFHAVLGLYERIREAAAAKVFALEVEFDPTLGYPTRIFIDRSNQWVDEELIYLVSAFQAL